MGAEIQLSIDAEASTLLLGLPTAGRTRGRGLSLHTLASHPIFDWGLLSMGGGCGGKTVGQPLMLILFSLLRARDPQE